MLVVGHGTGLDAFRRHAGKHHPALTARLVDFQVVDQPTVPQLVAQARQFFLKHDRMNGIPTPT